MGNSVYVQRISDVIRLLESAEKFTADNFFEILFVRKQRSVISKIIYWGIVKIGLKIHYITDQLKTFLWKLFWSNLNLKTKERKKTE